MRFTQIIVTAVSVAVSSAVSFTNTAADYQNLASGGALKIGWAGGNGPVKIYLGTGTPSNVQYDKANPIISSSSASGSQSYTLPSGGQYALVITDDSNVNYSGFFPVSGATSTPSASSATPSTATASTPSSASMPTSAISNSMTTPASQATTPATTGLPKTAPINITTAYTSLPTIVTKVGTYNSTIAAGGATGIPQGPGAGASADAGGAGGAGASGAGKYPPTTGTGAGVSTPSQLTANGASSLASPFALVFLAVAALFTLN